MWLLYSVSLLLIRGSASSSFGAFRTVSGNTSSIKGIKSTPSNKSGVTSLTIYAVSNCCTESGSGSSSLYAIDPG